MATVNLLAAAVLLLALPALSLAAECNNPVVNRCDWANLASREEQYAARQTYCGNNLFRVTPCFVQGRVKVTFTHDHGANTQQVCWDALENIINQCGSSFMEGSYNFNGVYSVSRCVKNTGGCMVAAQ